MGGREPPARWRAGLGARGRGQDLWPQVGDGPGAERRGVLRRPLRAEYLAVRGEGRRGSEVIEARELAVCVTLLDNGSTARAIQRKCHALRASFRSCPGSRPTAPCTVQQISH